jgi:ATP-binding cassette subfamily A (ABC1) protein 3
VAILLKKMTDFLTFRWFFMDKTVEATHVHSAKDDNDVIVENERVRSGKANEDLVVLNALSKQYPNGKQAVDFMSLGIPAGQCFGLLGINGAGRPQQGRLNVAGARMIRIVSMLAMNQIKLFVLLCITPNLTGKTTCMAMLTAEFPPSSGDAILASFSVSNEPDQTRRTIGYCPQFDAHFANMTGAEHVELYAVIKGFRRDLLNSLYQIAGTILIHKTHGTGIHR